VPLEKIRRPLASVLEAVEEELPREVEAGMGARELVAALRRRAALVLSVTAVLAVVSIVVAIVLPPTYRSSATIRVQEQEVPPDLVRSTITSFADERIQVISQQVMTRPVLLALIEKYDLYAKYRGRLTEDEILDRIRKDIKLTTINADISDRSSGRRVNATIAFTISYDAPRPDRAQKVVNELASLYLDENSKVRRQSVAETSEFLAQEADRLAKQIQSIEEKLALFKRRNVGRMPDSSAVNVQLADRTESELRRVEQQMPVLEDRKLSLESQLALIKPNISVASGPGLGNGTGEQRELTPEERLRALQSQYASMSVLYTADHPDIRRVRQEIAALKAQTAASARSAEKGSGANEAPDNPAYILLATQLQNTRRELAQLAASREDLRAKQRIYDARLMQIPEVEREYNELTRDYGNAQARYREIKTKEMQAAGAFELERDSKAERFSLGEPANLPQSPVKPNRLAIALGGLVASLGSGLGLAFLLEMFDPSVKGPLELARIAPVAILTAIPYIETQSERVGTRRRTLVLIALCGILGLAALYAIDSFVRPLPDLFDAAVRRMPIL
jgi:polysaccharide chain length determinant protein (PEP-CTERM system associated)